MFLEQGPFQIGNSISEPYPSVSVVVPARNAATHLEECLESIINQNAHPDMEIIIVDDGSSDDTYDIATGFSPAVYTVKTEFVGIGKARNIGLSQASGDVIVFTDSDCIAKQDWLSKLLAPFADGETAVQGNFYMQYYNTPTSRNHSLWRRSVYLKKHGLSKGGNELYLSSINTRNASLHQDIIHDVRERYGYVFDPNRWDGADDVEFGSRLFSMGVKLLLREEAIVYHMDPTSLKGILRQKFRHGYTQSKAGFSERLFDRENFLRTVVYPSKDGVSLTFSFMMWLAYTYGFQKGVLDGK